MVNGAVFGDSKSPIQGDVDGGAVVFVQDSQFSRVFIHSRRLQGGVGPEGDIVELLEDVVSVNLEPFGRNPDCEPLM